MNLFDHQFNIQERFFEKREVKDGELWLMSNFLPLEKAGHYFDALLNTINWRQEEIKMFGKVHNVPRKTAWYGNPGITYKYSGIVCYPRPWTSELLEIKKVIEHFLPGENFNSVLLNLYRDGNDKMGWHADDEPELGRNPTIASVSIGGVRRFDLKHKTDPGQKLQIHLPSGSLLVMKGSMQHHWMHQVPAQKKINDPRINLTFRTIKT